MLVHSPKIITNGLVLALDAANPKSYPGSGTTWFDLSGNGNNGTLVNGPTFDSANKGSIVFDGVNDYISLGTTFFISTGNPFTVQLWMNHNPRSSGTLFHRMITLNASGTTTLGIAYVPVLSSGYEGLYMTSNTGWARAYTQFKPASNVWGFLTLTYNGNGSTNAANFKMFWNTNQLTLLTSGVTVPAATTAANFLGVRQDGDGQVYNGKMSWYTIYNRELPSSEIQQNFNALRGRYGI